MTQDKNLLKSRFAANFRSYNALAIVQDNICGELIRIMSENISEESIKYGLEIGSGTGFLTHRLLTQFPQTQWQINDITEESQKYIKKYTSGCNVNYIWGDAETVIFPTGIDLIASASTIQWFDDIATFFLKVGMRMNRGGFMAISTFGKNNFHEIKTLTGEGLSYYTPDELSMMLATADFEIIMIKEDTKQLLFDTPTDVLRHIKATGVNSIRKTRWTKGRLAQFETEFYKNFSISDHTGKKEVTLTYHPIIILAKKK